MDKLLNKEKSKPLPLYKVPKTTWGQFWDFIWGQYEVILKKKKVGLYLYFKYQKHPA